MNSFGAKILPANATLIPLRGTLKMDFNGLLGVGDVKPSAITAPAFGDHLDEHTFYRRVWNVRDAIANRFHVQFHGVVPLDFALLHVLELDAAVVHVRVFIAASNL